MRLHLLIRTACSLILLLAAVPAVQADHLQTRSSLAGPMLVAVNAQGGIGLRGPSGGQLVLVRDGRVVRVMARGMPAPSAGGVAPSADGRYIAFGQEHAGLWVIRRSGTGLHRVLGVPRSTVHNYLGVEHVAWSPGGQLAYAISIASDMVITPSQDQALGIWVASLRPGSRVAGTPRRVSRPAGVFAPVSPGAIRSLSWSLSGRTLITSPSRLPSTILALDVATGTTRVLVPGGGDAAVSSTSGALAYVMGGDRASAATSLWIADPRGLHRRRLVSARGLIVHPTWSPDGRSVAYIGGPVRSYGGLSLHVVDVASGVDRIALTADAYGQHLLAKGFFVDLAWIRAG